MVDNPTKIYNDYVRANLPNSMSYDTGTDRYDINSHSFFKFKNSNWYFNYISKYGYSAFSAYAVNGFEPALVFDFKGNYFRKSATDSTFGASITHAATTNSTMTDGYGPEVVTNGTFDTDLSGWSENTSGVVTWDASGSALVGDGDGITNTLFTQDVSTIVGKSYVLTVDVSGTGLGVRVGVDNVFAGAGTYYSSGTVVFTWVADSTSEAITIYRFRNHIGQILVDNVSVRQSPALKWRPHNLLTHSGDLTNANWTKLRITLATGQNDFEGNPTAFKVTPTAVSGSHAFYKTTSVTNLVNGILSTLTIDVKADGYNFFSIALAGNKYAIINLSDGTVSLNTGSVSPTVTSLGNGWYRCSIIASSLNQQEVFSVVETPQGANHGATTFTGDGTSGVLVAYPHSFRSDLGGMVNNPDTTSSYVPTTSAVVYAPRRGQHIYNGSAWVNEGILHESEARTTILRYSSDYTGVDWTKNGTTATASAGVSPSGLTDSSLITASAITDEHRFYQNRPSAGTHNTFYTKSIYAKSGTANFISISGGSTSSGYAVFNLSTGVVSSQANIQQANIEDVGGGWYRCSIHGTVTSTFLVVNIGTTAANAVPQVNWLGAGETVQVYGSQWEAGATPSSYIPTTTASVTRAAEALTVPAANLPYDNTNMSIQIDGKMTYADGDNINEVQPYYWTLNGPNYIFARVSTSGTRSGQPTFLQRETTSGNDFVNGIPNAYTPDTNVPFNLASRHGSTFINGANEGTLLTVNTTPTALPPLSATDLNLGYNFMGTIGEFRMWSDDLGDVGITEATSPSTEPSLSLTFDGSETSFIVLDWSE